MVYILLQNDDVELPGDRSPEGILHEREGNGKSSIWLVETWVHAWDTKPLGFNIFRQDLFLRLSMVFPRVEISARVCL